MKILIINGSPKKKAELPRFSQIFYVLRLFYEKV